jgi:hypothetical protein
MHYQDRQEDEKANRSMLDPLEESRHLAHHIYSQERNHDRPDNKQNDHDQKIRQAESSRTPAQHASTLGSPTRLYSVGATDEYGVRDGAFFNRVRRR